ncbi:hypothetical protein [Gorillibacterium timonense]|uniref:hypothetical protein n=1 Tax=Gorillibacterium timonense TaxID=1689269 RepID=UPI00071CB41E|nr:hypothetical protein [Gorillibacterium timonense]
MAFHEPAWALMELYLSIPVTCLRKSQALSTAEGELNERNIRLSFLQLFDSSGAAYGFQVRKVKDVQWLHVVPSDYSRMFRAFGRMELSLSGLGGDGWPGDAPVFQELNFPASRLSSKSVLSIPTTANPINTRIERHLIKWIPAETKNVPPYSAEA